MPYGLFRTSYSLRLVLNVCHWYTAPHNPAQYLHIVKLTLHFYVYAPLRVGAEHPLNVLHHIGTGHKTIKPLLCKHIVVSGF